VSHVIHVSTGKGKIPEDEMEIATDLYAAMQSFFKKYDEYRPRPLFIMGESYAGKYVPSIGGSPFFISGRDTKRASSACLCCLVDCILSQTVGKVLMLLILIHIMHTGHCWMAGKSTSCHRTANGNISGKHH
jgi:hypothetical protein